MECDSCCSPQNFAAREADEWDRILNKTLNSAVILGIRNTSNATNDTLAMQVSEDKNLALRICEVSCQGQKPLRLGDGQTWTKHKICRVLTVFRR